MWVFLTAYQNRFIKKANWALAIEIFVRYYGTSSILYGPFFLYKIIFMLLFCDLIIHWVIKFCFSFLFWIPFKHFIEWSYWAITNKKFKSFGDFHIQKYSFQKFKCISWNISSPIQLPRGQHWKNSQREMRLGTHLELCGNTLKTTKIQKNRFTLVVIDISIICAVASALLFIDFCLINGPYSSYRFGSPWDLLFLFSKMFENSQKHFCLSFFMFP